jgi:Domain of unknown function (DUF5134)
MGNHVWGLSDLLAGAMLLVAAYCVARLVLSFRPRIRTRRDADVVHAVMGVSMAGMLAPSVAAGPTSMWVLIFLASTVWFGWRVVRDAERESVGTHPLGQHLPHLLMSAAMVYMLIVVAWSGSMAMPQRAGMMAMGAAGTSAARWSFLTIVLAVLLFGDGALTFGRSMRQAPQPSLVTAMPQGSPMSAAVAEGPGERPVGLRQDAAVLVDVQQSEGHRAQVLAPRSVMVCQLVMSLVMGYMLLSLV